MNFSGVITALVTPFKKGRLDLKSLRKLVRHQLDHGIQGFVVNGTTGESPNLSPEEIQKIFECVKKESNHTVPLILGVGSNSTAQTIRNLSLAKKLKADGVLVVVPYYNKPPQRGLIEHFRAVAKATRLPVILYNVPGRTVVSMDAKTVATLAKVKNIVGIKEASGRLELLEEIKSSVSSKFLLSSGDDATAIDFVFRGGHGVISVISHVIPRDFVDLVGRGREGDQQVMSEYKKFAQLNKLMGCEANPMPVKMALQMMGIIESAEVRLPLVTLSKPNQELLRQELIKLELLQ